MFATKPKDRYTNSHNQIVNFVNFFGNMKGFDKILDLINWNNGELRTPFSIIKGLITLLIQPLNLMLNLVKTDFLEKFQKVKFKKKKINYLLFNLDFF